MLATTMLLGGALAHDLDAQRTLLEPPHPAVAVGLSASLGFGSGHFYAGGPGTIFLLSQAAGLTAVIAGPRVASDPEAATALMVAGGVILGVSRLVEVPTAGLQAHRVQLDRFTERYAARMRQEVAQRELERLEQRAKAAEGDPSVNTLLDELHAEQAAEREAEARRRDEERGGQEQDQEGEMEEEARE